MAQKKPATNQMLHKKPDEKNIRNNPDGSKFLPIEVVEACLDPFNWSTRNFHYTLFKNGYADLCVSASIELVIHYMAEKVAIERCFVGACSFSLKAIEPNHHFLATAKSECVKNAASDIGAYFGRGLNEGFVSENQPSPVNTKPKMKPDSKIMQKFMDAVANKDEAAITMLTNIYDIKTEEK